MEIHFNIHYLKFVTFTSQLIRLLRAGASVLEKRRDSGHRPEIPSGLLKPEPKEEAEEEEEEEEEEDDPVSDSSNIQLIQTLIFCFFVKITH